MLEATTAEGSGISARQRFPDGRWLSVGLLLGGREIDHPGAFHVLHALWVPEPGDAFHDVADASRLLEDDERLLILLAAIVELHEEQLGMAEERGERIVDLVLERDGGLAD